MTKLYQHGRFAPSPTGPLHIGSVRTCLANIVLARSWSWRMEDTDRKRSSNGSMTDLIEGMGTLFGNSEYTHRQSMHGYQYGAVINELLRHELCYYASDCPEELEEQRRYNLGFKYKRKEQEELRRGQNEKASDTIRIDSDACIKYIAEHKKTEDKARLLRYGRENILKVENIDDFVLRKADRTPTYFIASAVDDRYSEIDLVIRGEEWLGTFGNTWLLHQVLETMNSQKIKHIDFLHLPLILNPDHTKMSKRKSCFESSVAGLLKKGYLPEAIVNYCFQLLVPSSNEKLSLSEIEKQNVSIDDIVSKPVCFDQSILDGYQRRWLSTSFQNIKEMKKLYSKIEEQNCDASNLNVKNLRDLSCKIIDKMPAIKVLDEISDVIVKSIDLGNFSPDVVDSLSQDEKNWLVALWEEWQKDTSKDPLEFREMVNLKTGIDLSNVDCLKLLQKFLMNSKSTFRINIISQYLSTKDLASRFAVLQ